MAGKDIPNFHLSVLTCLSVFPYAISYGRRYLAGYLLSGAVALQELNLKVRPLNNLLRGPPALSAAQNVNMLWAHLMVDELCRLGASTFCIAPGQSALLLSKWL